MAGPLASEAGGEREGGRSPPLANEAAARVVRDAIRRGPLVVNHWATWCEPCVSELPALVELHRRVAGRVPFVGVSWELFEPFGSIEEVTRIASGMGITWPSLVVTDGPDALFEALSMDCRLVPQTWLVDRAGAVVHRVEGTVEDEKLDDLLARIEQLA